MRWSDHENKITATKSDQITYHNKVRYTLGAKETTTTGTLVNIYDIQKNSKLALQSKSQTKHSYDLTKHDKYLKLNIGRRENISFIYKKKLLTSV